jgi:hypothetical protein
MNVLRQTSTAALAHGLLPLTAADCASAAPLKGQDTIEIKLEMKNCRKRIHPV